MPIEGAIPGWLLSAAAAATLFVVMFDLGIAIVPGEFRWVLARPARLGKALFAVLFAVPVVALVVTRALDLPRHAEVGIVLMAIAPGAPVALRRSLGAGGHRAFAPALQISLAILAVASMPLSIAALDEYYGASASIDPRHLARQVFTAQLLPLGVGMLVRRLLPLPAARFEPRLRRVGGILLVVLVALALVNIGPIVVDAGWRVALAIVVVTAIALAVGHLLGGPDPGTRTATAISSAARNPGLALLVAALNAAPPGIGAAVLAYFVFSALTVVPYVAWRRRTAAAKGPDG